MTRAGDRPPAADRAAIVIVDSRPGPTTAAHAEALVAWLGAHHLDSHVVVWGDDVPDPVLGSHPGAHVLAGVHRRVMTSPLRRVPVVARAVRSLLLRRRLRAAGAVPCYLDGTAVAGAVAWLPAATGPVVWHLQPGETMDPAVALAVAARVDRFLVSEPAQAEALGRAGVSEDLISLVPPHLPVLATRERRPPGAPAVVGVVGPATWEAGADLVARLGHAVQIARPGTRLVWAGPGSDPVPVSTRIDLDRLGGHTVRLEPAPAPLGVFLADIDVLAVVSRSAADPHLVLEALSRGVPVVAWDGPTGEALSHEVASAVRLVPFPSIPAFADASVAVADDPTLSARLVNRHGSGQTARLLSGWIR